MQRFVRIIYAKLLETVASEILETEDIKNWNASILWFLFSDP